MAPQRRLFLHAAVILVLVAALFAGGVSLSRGHELAAADQNLLDTDRAVAAQVESEFGTILSVLRQAANRIQERGAVDRIDAEDLAAYLLALKTGVPLVDSIIVADADGTVRAGSRGVPTPAPSIADREYFPLLKAAPPGTVEVTPPLINRVSGARNFLIARRLDTPAGFGGVVVAAVRPEHIGTFFAKVNTVSDAKLSVVRYDGTMLFRIPAGHLGAKVVTHWIREKSDFGSTRFTSVLDGIERIAAYRVLPNLPLVVVISRDVGVVLAPWRQRMLWAAGGVAGLLCVILPLWLFAGVQASRRRAALAALRESEERLRAILAASPFPILVSRRADGAVLLHNDRAAVLFGAAVEQGPLHDDRFFETPADRSALAARLERSGTIQDMEVRLRAASGMAFWALVSVTAVRIGAQEVVLTAVNDISARKRSEEETQAARHAAERALDDLRQAQSRLVQSEKLASLGGLVAGVAHEVNTPLGIVLTSSTFLADALDQFARHVAAGNLRRQELDNFLRTQREGMDLLVTNSQRAADLIQSFKQVAADQTSDVRRRFNLAHWLNDLLFSLSPTWKRTRHQVVADCPPDLEMDGYPGVLGQVVSNLITNALLHAYPPGHAGTVRVTVAAVDPGMVGAGMVEIACADDGRGIPADQLGRIFEPFYTTRRNAGSTGLGLHIVHNLVTGPLGGTVTVSSRDGEGTRFTLRLPGTAPHADAAREAGASAG